jgi:hypothetical protein
MQLKMEGWDIIHFHHNRKSIGICSINIRSIHCTHARVVFVPFAHHCYTARTPRHCSQHTGAGAVRRACFSGEIQSRLSLSSVNSVNCFYQCCLQVAHGRAPPRQSCTTAVLLLLAHILCHILIRC